MSASAPITAGAKLTVIDALKGAISDDVQVEVQDFVSLAMPANAEDNKIAFIGWRSGFVLHNLPRKAEKHFGTERPVI